MTTNQLIPEPFQNRSGPIPDEYKPAIKEKLLETLGKTNIVQISCESAGITRATFNSWINHGLITREDLDDALERYRDQIRAEITKRTFVGVRKPLLSNGRVVKDDNNQPIYNDVPDSRLLIEMAKHILPEWMQAERTDALHGDLDKVPAQYLLQIDARLLLPDEFQIIKDIATAIEMRAQGVVE